MRTHELARHLELLAKFLRRFPDVEMDPKRSLEFQEFIPGMGAKGEISEKNLRALPEDIQEQLSIMSPAEIEDFLLSGDKGFTAVSISELAQRLGLTSSKRQSKNALVNMIARHYEASKMHAIMRGSGPNENKPSPDGD